MQFKKVDIVVVGGGIVGLTTTLMFERLGLKTICIEPHAPALNSKSLTADLRTTAYLQKSIKLFKKINIWNKLLFEAEELKVMTIGHVNSVSGDLQSITNFSADELGIPCFAYNIPNWSTKKILLDAIGESKNAEIYLGKSVISMHTQLDEAIIDLSDHSTISATLVVAADGRNSTARELNNISMRKFDANQDAITLEVSHTKPHFGKSIEILKDGGPCTLVPMKSKNDDHRSAVVWIEKRKTAKDLMILSDSEFEQKLSKRIHGWYGKLTLMGRRNSYPISTQLANDFSAHRLALVGEAAHVMPPIGAQGLNSSFEDIEALSNLVRDAIETKNDIGANEILGKYSKSRKNIINGRIFGVSLLNTASKSSNPSVQRARQMGLKFLANNSYVRKAVMRIGLGDLDFFQR